ncbi:hypothetical protein VDGE_20973 [Verticillium dahliae]|uniref:DUF1445 domain-containing protein n=1 Tax=Verticillium dahliae TaxID=27337 RepID=A0A444S9B8_VERDA|nr:hypothetical protein VDGE_20973 [Verticillium dahliae]
MRSIADGETQDERPPSSHSFCSDALERLGIKDVNVPQWGDAPLTMDGRPLWDVAGDDENVPVFWGCGVTPQEAVIRADLEGTVMAHAPGHMLVLDCMEDQVLK